MTNLMGKGIGTCDRGHHIVLTREEANANRLQHGRNSITCRCGADVTAWRLIVANYRPDTRCGARCTGATGPVCNCSCRGEHHGESWRS